MGAATKAKITVSLSSVTGFQKVSITMMASRAGKASSTNDTAFSTVSAAPPR